MRYSGLYLLFLLIFFSCEKEEKKTVVSPVKSNVFNEEITVRTIKPRSDLNIVKTIRHLEGLIEKEDLKNLTSHLNKKEIENRVQSINRAVKQKELEQYIYPSMSFIGGSLKGYFKDSFELKYIDAYHAGELGGNGYNIYWDKQSIIKIESNNSMPKWEEYWQKYPHEKFEFDHSKMNYTETSYIIYITDKGVDYIKKYNNKIVSTKMSTERDSNTVQFNYNGGFQMKKEMEIQRAYSRYLKDSIPPLIYQTQQ